MVKYLAIFAILTIGSGCCSTPAHSPITLPPRPILEPIEQELWIEIPEHTKRIITSNDLALKEYAARLESRIRIHNGDGE